MSAHVELSLRLNDSDAARHGHNAERRNQARPRRGHGGRREERHRGEPVVLYGGPPDGLVLVLHFETVRAVGAGGDAAGS